MPTPLARDNTFRPTANADGLVGQISYNGITFPPLTRATGKYVPEYDNAGRITKYIRGSIEVEAYLYPGCLDYNSTNPTSTTPLPYYDAGVAAGGITKSVISSKDVTTDTSLVLIRKRLNEPCQHLKFILQGFGKVDLNDPSRSLTNRDVDNGPKPKEVSWVPLTNKMAKITWRCDFALAPCADPTTGILPSTIAQFPFDVTINVGPGGLSTRTITGVFERALTRQSQPLGGQAGPSMPFDMKADEEFILKFFPIMKQFHREATFNMSSDRKTVTFTLVDTEINSDDSFGPGIENIDAELSLSGQLNPGAFRKWGVTLAGSVDVMAGYPKSFAFLQITNLFQHYFAHLAYQGSAPTRVEVPKWVEGLDILDSGILKGESFPILNSVKLSDQIFGRTVKFSFSWDLFVKLQTLFKATGIFLPIDSTNTARNAAWDLWKSSAEVVLDRAGYQELGFTQTNDIVVSLCQPLLGKAYDPSPVPEYPKESPDKEPKEKDMTTDSSEKSKTDLYAMYDSQFWIDAVTGTMSHIPLFYEPINPESLNPKLKDTKKIEWPKTGTGSDATLFKESSINHKRHRDSYILTFSGSAIRLGYPVPIPRAKSYGGALLAKVGTDYIRPYKLGNGVDVTTGKNYSIHGLVWQKRYALPSAPLDGTIESDGLSVMYV